MTNYCAAFRSICLSILMLFLANAPAFAAKLVFTDVTTSSVKEAGTGQGKRALYSKAGTVGGVSVDLVAKLVTATTNPNFDVQGSRISISSSGFDTIWADWYIYKAGTYKLATDSGGEAVSAEVMVQFADIDGPNNEQLFIPLCAPPVEFARISRKSTLLRSFGTVAGVPEVFSDIGDKNYTAQPESGAEISYSTTSVFRMGRTASNSYLISPATGFSMASVNLAAPSGATGIIKDANGDVTGFTVTGQGVWSYSELTSTLTFTPQTGYRDSPAPIQYTFKNAIGTLSNLATVTVTYPQLEIIKTATPPAIFAVGAAITYAFKVTNPGLLTVSGITVTDSLPNIVITGGPITLAGKTSDTTTFTATYKLTQVDMNAGQVVNTATATGKTPQGNPLKSLPSTVTTIIPKLPSLAIVKTAGRPSGNNVGATIPYTFTVTNTGTLTMANVTVMDSLPGIMVKGGPITLAPGAIDTTTFTALYTLTQKDIDAGEVKNSATAKGNPPVGPPLISPPSDVTTKIEPKPGLTVEKSGGTPSGSVVGATIPYTFSVTNTGNVTLTNVTVSDPLPGIVVKGTPIPTLAPGAEDTTTFTALYTLTQKDINAGGVTNTANVIGTPPVGPPLKPVPSNPVVTPLTPAPAMTLVKSAKAPMIIAVDAPITYNFAVRNTGNVTLKNVTISDTLKGIALVGGPITSLAPGEEDTQTFTATYKLTQADIDTGGVDNEATAKATTDKGTQVEAKSAIGVDVSQGQVSKLTLVKTAGTPSGNIVGSTVPYTFTVKNEGNVTVNNISVSDALPGVVMIGGPIPSLKPGEQDTKTFTATYKLTQADINRGRVDNVAVAKGTRLTGKQKLGVGPAVEEEITSPQTRATALVAAGPELSISKKANKASVAALGEEIAYTFLVTNTGNVTLTNVAVSDDRLGSAQICVVAELVPGADSGCSATYKVTQADLDAGSVKNVASVIGTPPVGPPLQPIPSNPVTTPVTSAPSLTIVKNAGAPSGNVVGATIPYTFTVTNTGNVTLTNVSVADSLPGITVKGAPIPLLVPGAKDTATSTALYTLTQRDIDAGEVKNSATAKGNPPVGPPLVSPPSDVTTKIDAAPALTVVKSAGTPSGSLVGTSIPYTFTVTNTGNVTLTNVTVSDPLPGIVIKGAPIASLAPGAKDTTTFTALYTLTQKDIDAGGVTNIALVTGVPPVGPPLKPIPSNPVVTPINHQPLIDLEMIGSKPSSNKAGAVVEYTFKVKNTGNVTLIDCLLTNALPGLVLRGGPITVLKPGEEDSSTYTATYTLTQADIDAGQVLNKAIATGTPPVGEFRTPGIVANVTSPERQALAVVEAGPALTIVKNAGTPSGNTAGSTIAYTFTVTNIGNVTLANVSVADSVPGVVLTGTPIASLAPGAADATTFSALYTLTQNDVDAGQVVNSATTTGTPPNGVPPITSVPHQVVTPIAPAPALLLLKTAGKPSTNRAGGVVPYQFRITNTGNITLTNITISDILPGIVISGGPVPSLSPGQVDSTTFTATYVMQQADIEAGRVYNKAKATGRSPRRPVPLQVNVAQAKPLGADPVASNIAAAPGDPAAPGDEESTDSNDSDVVVLIDSEPDLTVTKTGTFNDENHNNYSDAGETITYRFVVANKGNVVLNDVSPIDTGPVFNSRPPAGKLSAFTPGPSLIELGEERTFTATYTLAQADVDAAAAIKEGVVNTATAHGFYNGDATTGIAVDTRESRAVLDLPAAYGEHDVSITKQVGLRQIKRGEKAPFTINVTNNGNNNAGPVIVTDTLPSGFRFVDGSATVNGVAAIPILNGRTARFENLPLGPKAEVTIRLQMLALSTAEPGKHTNRARVTEIDGELLAPEATASIEIMIEPVFDCGDVVGKVFDDLNGDGYQDEGEPGLPGVRVATVKGFLVTTDKYGRFHVACADLPDKRIGSNFIMKLDTRTLPTGYGVTTENPRVVRLTAGKMSKLSFGASIGHVVSLDLTDAAFERGTTILKKQWSDGLDGLVGVLKQQPSTLRIFYLVSVVKELATERITAIQEDISKRWKSAGGEYELNIETRVEVGQ